MATQQDPHRPGISLWTLALGPLTIPLVATIPPAGPGAKVTPLVWLVLLIPVVVLVDARGWRGMVEALAAGTGTVAICWALAGTLDRGDLDRSLLSGVLLTHWLIALAVGLLAKRLRGRAADAEQWALTDDLTELPNRRHARLFLQTEFAAAQRGRTLSVVLFDVDHFKEFNDRNGHIAGDEALRAFSRLLRSQIRQMHLAARVGGEEFLCILSDCDPGGAQIFAERLCAASREIQGLSELLTVSAGVASFDPSMLSPDDLVAAADEALYEAKRGGRDRVHVCTRLAHAKAVRILA